MGDDSATTPTLDPDGSPADGTSGDGVPPEEAPGDPSSGRVTRSRTPGRLTRIRRWAERHPVATVALRVAVALGAAAAMAAVALGSASDELGSSVRASVVGYPTWASFSPEVYLARYVAVVGAVLGALAVDTGLRLVLVGVPPATEPLRRDPARVDLAGLGAGVGALLGALGAVTLGIGSGKVAALAVCGGVACWAAGRLALQRDLPARAQDAIALVAAGLLPLGLAAVAATTAIDAPDGLRRINWFPPYIAVPVALVAVGVLALRVRRSGGGDRLVNDVLVGVAGPVAVVLVTAKLPGTLGPLDAFHDGEGLYPAAAFLDGLLPWRDLALIHGWMQDMLRSLPGVALIENSRWGSFAGDLLWVNPLSWVAVYAVVVRMARRRLLVVALLLVAIGSESFFWTGGAYGFTSRMLPFWVFLAVLGLVFESPSAPRLALAAFAGIGALVLTPESLILVGPALLVLLAQTVLARPGWRAVVVRVGWMAVGLAGAVAVLGTYLALTGSGPGFVEWYTTFVGNHVLYGAVPLADGDNPYFWWAAVAAVALPLWVLCRLVVRVRSDRDVTSGDWVAGALALGGVAYYSKFLARPDGHVFHVWTMVLPLAFYAADVAAGWVVALVARTPAGDGHGALRTPARRVAVTGVAAVVVLATLNTYTSGRLDLSGRFRPVTTTVDRGKLGYSEPDAAHVSAEDLDAARRALTAAGGEDGVLDFSNSPALIYYLLGFEPAHRFHNISVVASSEDQEQMVADLEEDPPNVVVWGTNVGLGSWDEVSNPLRHHRVASWIIDNYVPWATVAGIDMWVPRDRVDQLPDPTTLGAQPAPAVDTHYLCNWNDVPRHLDDGPTRAQRTQAVDVPLVPATGLQLSGWVVVGDQPAATVQALDGDEVVAETIVGVPRPDVGAALAPDDAAMQGQLSGSGFSLVVDTTTGIDPDRLTYRAVTDDGRTTGLTGTPDDPGSVRPAGPVLPGTQGIVDRVVQLDRSQTRLFRAELPADAGSADWLGVSARPGPEETHVSIGPSPADPATSLSFDLAPRARSEVVHAGACTQWSDIGTVAYVAADGPAVLRSLTLYGTGG